MEPAHVEQTPRQAIATCQVVTAAMAAGILLFGVVAFIIAPVSEGMGPAFNCVLLSVALVQVAARFVVIPLMKRPRPPVEGSPPDAASGAALSGSNGPVARFVVAHIVGCAMLEGAAFVCLISFMLTAYLPSILAAAAVLALIVASFPTEQALRRYLAAMVDELSA